MDKQKIEVQEQEAEKLLVWLSEGRGVAQWRSAIDGGTFLTPVITKDRRPVGRPHWSVPAEQSPIIADKDHVVVVRGEVFSSFHVATEQGGGLTLVLTSPSKEKLLRELEKAGDGSWCEFEHAVPNNCTVFRGVEKIPLSEWEKARNDPDQRKVDRQA